MESSFDPNHLEEAIAFCLYVLQEKQNLHYTVLNKYIEQAPESVKGFIQTFYTGTREDFKRFLNTFPSLFTVDHDGTVSLASSPYYYVKIAEDSFASLEQITIFYIQNILYDESLYRVHYSDLHKYLTHAPDRIFSYIKQFYSNPTAFGLFLMKQTHLFQVSQEGNVSLVQNTNSSQDSSCSFPPEPTLGNNFSKRDIKTKYKAVNFFAEILKKKGSKMHFNNMKGHLGYASKDILKYINSYYPKQEFLNFFIDSPSVFSTNKSGYVRLMKKHDKDSATELHGADKTVSSNINGTQNAVTGAKSKPNSAGSIQKSSRGASTVEPEKMVLPQNAYPPKSELEIKGTEFFIKILHSATKCNPEGIHFQKLVAKLINNAEKNVSDYFNNFTVSQMHEFFKKRNECFQISKGYISLNLDWTFEANPCTVNAKCDSFTAFPKSISKENVNGTNVPSNPTFCNTSEDLVRTVSKVGVESLEERVILYLTQLLNNYENLHYNKLISYFEHCNEDIEDFFSKFTSSDKFRWFKERSERFNIESNGYVSMPGDYTFSHKANNSIPGQMDASNTEKLHRELAITTLSTENKNSVRANTSMTCDKILDISKVERNDVRTSSEPINDSIKKKAINCFIQILRTEPKIHFLHLFKQMLILGEEFRTSFGSLTVSEMYKFFKDEQEYFNVHSDSYVTLNAGTMDIQKDDVPSNVAIESSSSHSTLANGNVKPINAVSNEIPFNVNTGTGGNVTSQQLANTKEHQTIHQNFFEMGRITNVALDPKMNNQTQNTSNSNFSQSFCSVPGSMGVCSTRVNDDVLNGLAKNTKFPNHKAREKRLISFFKDLIKLMLCESVHYQELIENLQFADSDIKYFFSDSAESEIIDFFKTHPEHFHIDSACFISLIDKTCRQKENQSKVENNSLTQLPKSPATDITYLETPRIDSAKNHFDLEPDRSKAVVEVLNINDQAVQNDNKSKPPILFSGDDNESKVLSSLVKVLKWYKTLPYTRLFREMIGECPAVYKLFSAFSSSDILWFFKMYEDYFNIDSDGEVSLKNPDMYAIHNSTCYMDNSKRSSIDSNSLEIENFDLNAVPEIKTKVLKFYFNIVKANPKISYAKLSGYLSSAPTDVRAYIFTNYPGQHLLSFFNENPNFFNVNKKGHVSVKATGFMKTRDPKGNSETLNNSIPQVSDLPCCHHRGSTSGSDIMITSTFNNADTITKANSQCQKSDCDVNSLTSKSTIGSNADSCAQEKNNITIIEDQKDLQKVLKPIETFGETKGQNSVTIKPNLQSTLPENASAPINVQSFIKPQILDKSEIVLLNSETCEFSDKFVNYSDYVSNGLRAEHGFKSSEGIYDIASTKQSTPSLEMSNEIFPRIDPKESFITNTAIVNHEKQETVGLAYWGSNSTNSSKETCLPENKVTNCAYSYFNYWQNEADSFNEYSSHNNTTSVSETVENLNQPLNFGNTDISDTLKLNIRTRGNESSIGVPDSSQLSVGARHDECHNSSANVPGSVLQNHNEEKTICEKLISCISQAYSGLTTEKYECSLKTLSKYVESIAGCSGTDRDQSLNNAISMNNRIRSVISTYDAIMEEKTVLFFCDLLIKKDRYMSIHVLETYLSHASNEVQAYITSKYSGDNLKIFFYIHVEHFCIHIDQYVCLRTRTNSEDRFTLPALNLKSRKHDVDKERKAIYFYIVILGTFKEKVLYTVLQSYLLRASAEVQDYLSYRYYQNFDKFFKNYPQVFVVDESGMVSLRPKN